MYSYLGDVASPRLALEEFSISAPGNSHKEFIGGEIISECYPRIKIRVSVDAKEQGVFLTLRLIRFGKLIKTFSNQGLLDIDFTDEVFEPGKKIYYRLDLNDNRNRKIVSNPIFVKFQASRNAKSQASEAID